MGAVRYLCVFPKGEGYTSLKSIADKIYALSIMIPDDNDDDDGNPPKDLVRQDTDGSLAIVPSEQGDGSALATIASGKGDEGASDPISPSLKTAPRRKKTVRRNNWDYAVLASSESLSEPVKRMFGSIVDFQDGWVTEKCRLQV